MVCQWSEGLSLYGISKWLLSGLPVVFPVVSEWSLDHPETSLTPLTNMIDHLETPQRPLEETIERPPLSGDHLETVGRPLRDHLDTHPFRRSLRDPSVTIRDKDQLIDH